MEFIDMHSILKDKSMTYSVPNYFNHSETPIICYIYILRRKSLVSTDTLCNDFVRQY